MQLSSTPNLPTWTHNVDSYVLSYKLIMPDNSNCYPVPPIYDYFTMDEICPLCSGITGVKTDETNNSLYGHNESCPHCKVKFISHDKRCPVDRCPRCCQYYNEKHKEYHNDVCEIYMNARYVLRHDRFAIMLSDL